MNGAAPGTCTVILARPGAVDRSDDFALLRAVEVETHLPKGSLVRAAGMDRPEFRLVEGVDRRTADRLAQVASGLGFVPRVRDRTDIKWSNQPRRDGWGPMALMLLSIFAVPVAAAFSPAGPLTAMLLFTALLLTVQLAVRWRMSQRFMPLVLQAQSLFTAHAETESPARTAALRARRALDALARWTDSRSDSGADLRKTERQLRAEVDALERQGQLLHEATVAGLAALDGQLAWLADRPDASAEVLERVQASIDAEDAAIRARDARLHEIVASILDLEQVAVAARTELESEPRAKQPLASLQSRASALRRGQLVAAKEPIKAG